MNTCHHVAPTIVTTSQFRKKVPKFVALALTFTFPFLESVVGFSVASCRCLRLPGWQRIRNSCPAQVPTGAADLSSTALLPNKEIALWDFLRQNCWVNISNQSICSSETLEIAINRMIWEIFWHDRNYPYLQRKSRKILKPRPLWSFCR